MDNLFFYSSNIDDLLLKSVYYSGATYYNIVDYLSFLSLLEYKISIVCFFFVLAAIGKSAQAGLHI